jgi:4'-phosphopantetheinyl transferase
VQYEYNERRASSEGDTSVATLKCLARARGNNAGKPQKRISYIEGWRKTVGTAAHEPAADRDRIEVWLGPVQGLAADDSYREILSANELLALDQIRSPVLHNRKLAGRLLLRTALSHAVGGRIGPHEWRISPDVKGRPVIARGMPQINFSISYAEPVAVVAVSEGLPVGIDVETVEDTTEDMIAAYCCSCEQSLLDAGPASQNSREFVRLWTLKEAYTKLVGLGHGIEFDSIGFSLDSLHLLHGTSAQIKNRKVHFETMWVTSGRTLNHVSIAIDFSSSPRASADLQVMSVASADDSAPAIHVPNINILGHENPPGTDRQ